MGPRLLLRVSSGALATTPGEGARGIPLLEEFRQGGGALYRALKLREGVTDPVAYWTEQFPSMQTRSGQNRVFL